MESVHGIARCTGDGYAVVSGNDLASEGDMRATIIGIVLAVMAGCGTDTAPGYSNQLSCPEQYDACLTAAGPEPTKLALCRCAIEANHCTGIDGGSCD